MKKLLLSFAMPWVAFISFAQINKGNTLLGGNLSFNFQQQNYQLSSSYSNTNVQPYIQFAYKANRTIGFGLDFTYNSTSNNDGQNKTQTFSIGPSVSFTQYHPIKGNFGW
jgi:lipopolysaccharide assembly outer membrane protein LptD (OstA)